MSRKSEVKRGYPFTVHKGQSVSITIYLQTRQRGGQAFHSYIVAVTDHGKRTLKAFSDQDEAHTYAEAQSKLFDQRGSVGQMEGLILTGVDRMAYQTAIKSLAGTGKRLDLAMADYSAAVAKLAKHRNTPLADVVDDYLRRNVNVIRMQVAEAVAEYLADKQGQGMSPAYMQGIRYRLNRFGESFNTPLVGLVARDVDQWIIRQKLGPRSIKNMVRTVQSFCNWCIGKKYLPKGWDELDTLTIPKQKPGRPTIYTPAEVGKLLASARPEMVPFIAILAFAGVRHAECLRLDWRNIDLGKKFLAVDAGMAKTASRRLVPIPDNLVEWLAPYRRKSGPVCDFKNPSDELPGMSEAAGVKWKRNALRHSYCSYRLAVVKSVDAVALEAGNSAAMIFRNYRELVTEEDAAAWFAVSPAPPANVIPMAARA